MVKHVILWKLKDELAGEEKEQVLSLIHILMAVSGLAIGMTVAKSKNSLKAFK